jgi:hypothetical protein
MSLGGGPELMSVGSGYKFYKQDIFEALVSDSLR